VEREQTTDHAWKKEMSKESERFLGWKGKDRLDRRELSFRAPRH